MNNIQELRDEIVILNTISSDTSFDKIILQDAIEIINVKNKQIVDLGGEPIQQTIAASVGTSKEDIIETIIAQMNAYKRFITRNPEALARYNALDGALKRRTGVSYDEYVAGARKFFYGGELVKDNVKIINDLVKTNEFAFIRESKDDPILRYKTPIDSILLEVITPKTNVIYALGYFYENQLILDFYRNDILKNSLNLTHSFPTTYTPKEFELAYIDLKEKLKEIDKRIG